jgi:ketosteroid isomerase-like protein
MWRMAIATGLLMLGVSSSVIASPTTAAELMAAPHKFVDSIEAGKFDQAAAVLTADVTIIDEFPPHAWSGADAFKHWGADYDATSKAAHMTNSHVKLGDPLVAQAEGDVAYVVAAASETYKQDGKRMAESSRMAFALRREGGVWKIAAFAWAGREPHLKGAGAAKKPTP